MYKDEFSIVGRVHTILAAAICPGDTVVDATAGRGNDTLFLGQLVGPRGKVWAFDRQAEACDVTKEKLAQQQMGWVEVVCDDHSKLASYIQTPIKAGVFNLGYLPGANHQIITKGETTLAALQAMMELLLPEGVIILVCYLGHAGGKSEYDMIYASLGTLPATDWCVEEYHFINKQLAPRIIKLKRLAKGDVR